MTVHNIGLPSGSVNLFEDGNPAIWLGNWFYSAGGLNDGWQCSGGRVFLPATAGAIVGSTIEITAYHRTTPLPDADLPHFDFLNDRTAWGTVTAQAGWNDVHWTPFDIADGEFVFIGYHFADLPMGYVFSDLGTSSPIGSETLAGLYLAEVGLPRGEFHIDSNQAGGGLTSSNWYGTDIIVDDNSGGTTPTGAADLDFSFDITAAGSRPAKGVAALDVSFDLTAAGQTSRTGSAQLDATFDVTAAGRTERRGAADLDLRYDVTAAGHAPTLDVPTGGAALDASFDLTVSGRTERRGAAALTASFDLTVAGQAPGQTQQRVTARLSADNVTVTLSAENVTTRIEE